MTHAMLPHGPLTGLRVVDLTRVLAGPVCTQILGDMGADIVKVERPDTGDDTRAWGPPFLKDRDGNDTKESAYYLCANRNKTSLPLDLSDAHDRARLLGLLADADVLVENFKAGSLDRLGLSYAQLRDRFPRLVYCSITGFGHTGPSRDEAGYDFMIQGLCGFMSLTGTPDGPPVKAGVAIVDYVTGLNAATAILAALRARDVTGSGQHIDMALYDCGLAMMVNAAQYALTTGQNPPRAGNAHATIMPYNAVRAADGWFILAIGNDTQFQKFCTLAHKPEWVTDPRFATNAARVTHRADLTKALEPVLATRTADDWMDALHAAGIPCGPIRTMTEALDSEQTAAREMTIKMDHPLTDTPVTLVGSPYKFSATPVTYRTAPPLAPAKKTNA